MPEVNNMTPQDLTAAAAKALGLKVIWEPESNAHRIAGDQGLPNDLWTPLDDDITASQLSLGMNMTVRATRGRESDAYSLGYPSEIVVLAGPDTIRLTHAVGADWKPVKRRAIVLAAATIAERL